MALYKIEKKLEYIKEKPFRLEKEIQELTENNLKTIFGLEFVKSEFALNNFRIDTLAFDKEANAFVIIEYKRDKNFSVIDQGYAVRTGAFKMVYNWEYDKAELYNIKKDFEELHNIAANHPEMVAIMKEKLVQHAGKFAPVRKTDTQWPFVSTELSNKNSSTNIYVQNINDEVRKVLDFKKGTGVYITHINKENFVAKSKSINVAYNYLLTKIGGVEIKNVQHAIELLKDKKMEEEVPAVFWKAGKEKPCVLKMEKSSKI